MLVKKITYIDFNDEEQTDEFCFNMTEHELAEMTISPEGGLEVYLRELIRSKDPKRISDMVKTLILNAYGEKSQDGRKFRKSPEISKEFEYTAAFSELFMELINDAEKLAYFVVGIIPAKMLNGRDPGSLVQESLSQIKAAE